MINWPVTYDDLETGKSTTESFWFNLDKLEIAEFNFGAKGGMADLLQGMSETLQPDEIFPALRSIVRRAYGVRDGVRFRKSKEMADDFESHPAFGELIVGLLQRPTELVTFFAGIMPGDAINTAAKLNSELSAKGISFDNAKDGEIVGKVVEGETHNVFNQLPAVDESAYGPDAVELPLEPGEGYTDKQIANMTTEELRAALANPRNLRTPE